MADWLRNARKGDLILRFEPGEFKGFIRSEQSFVRPPDDMRILYSPCCREAMTERDLGAKFVCPCGQVYSYWVLRKTSGA